MIFSPELILQILGPLVAGFGAYAAIRADLARLHERATHALETADKANRRIDNLQERRAN